MVKTATASAFGNVFSMPAHPAPDGDAWGVLQGNCHSFKLTSGVGAHVHLPHPQTTLLQIYVSGPCYMLVNGGLILTSPELAVANDQVDSAFPLAAAGYYSFSVDRGKHVSFQVDNGSPDVLVTVLEG